MKSASFPRDMQRDAKAKRQPLVRLQYDTRHWPKGVGVEVVGVAPAWVVDAIEDILSRWRREENEGTSSDTLH
jgi:hypothetical protein